MSATMVSSAARTVSPVSTTQEEGLRWFRGGGRTNYCNRQSGFGWRDYLHDNYGGDVHVHCFDFRPYEELRSQHQQYK
ncbi:unnamed protein product [Victoria cruziana]